MLAFHKAEHRRSYSDNTFIQMLHKSHEGSNLTKCWIFGLLPSDTHKAENLLSLPLSYVGSCEGWFELFNIVSQDSPLPTLHRAPVNFRTRTHTVVMQHRTPSGTHNSASQDSRQFLKTCLSSYKGIINTTWAQMEKMNFQGFNTTDYFQSFLSRNVSNDEP